MNKKSTFLNLLLAAAILVVVNYLVGGLGFLNVRKDLTEKKIYTLSDGTRRILTSLSAEKPVAIRFYATRDSRIMPQFVQSYATTVEDLLLEFEKASNGKITLEKIDPRPDTEDEDRAIADDIQGHVMNQEGAKAYFGLAIQCLQQKEVLPVLLPNDEGSLEYNIARALAKVSQTKRSVVGIMSAMPIAGPASNLPPMFMQRQQQPPWVFVQQLRLDYDVREIAPSGDAIDSDVDVLLVVHPADLSLKAEFAIDQYLLKGGKVIAMVDPQCLVTQAYNSPGQMGMPPASSVSNTSDLKHLFKAWGINYDSQVVVADMTSRTISQGRPQPTFLTIGREGLNRDEILTGSLDMLQMISAGALKVEPKEGINATVLVESSENVSLIDHTQAEASRREGLKSFNPEGKSLPLVVQLSGKFSTAFPAGPPSDSKPELDSLPKVPGEAGGAADDAGAPQTDAAPDAAPQDGTPSPAPATAPEAPTPQPAPQNPVETTAPAPAPAPAPNGVPAPAKDAEAPAPAAEAPPVPAGTPGTEGQAAPAPGTEEKAVEFIKASEKDGVVIVFGDVDMEYDMFAFESDASGRIIPAYKNSNIPLLLNAVEMLSGGTDLIDVRSRGLTKRTFTRMEELRESVESEYRPQIEEGNRKLNEILQKAASLGGAESEKGVVVLNINAEQRDQLNAEAAEVRKSIRDLQKDQNRRKDQVELRITLLNLALVPVFIIIFGLVVAIYRRSSEAAR